MMQQEEIIKKLKESGCRITKQRLAVLDVILEHECFSAKEVFYYVSKVDSGVGQATVYRMLNTLEEIGVLGRRNIYVRDDVNEKNSQ